MYHENDILLLIISDFNYFSTLYFNGIRFIMLVKNMGDIVNVECGAGRC